jgi:hypothetical protein
MQLSRLQRALDGVVSGSGLELWKAHYPGDPSGVASQVVRISDMEGKALLSAEQTPATRCGAEMHLRPFLIL